MENKRITVETEESDSYREISDPSMLVADPVVSVRMVTYNHGPYIAQAIEGVVMQETEYPFELIIGEDCSTDNTRQIVLDYQKKYPKIIRVLAWKRNVGSRRNSKLVEWFCPNMTDTSLRIRKGCSLESFE